MTHSKPGAQPAVSSAVPAFYDRQIWDPRIRAYRLVRVDEAEMTRLRFVRQENQRRQDSARCPRASRTS